MHEKLIERGVNGEAVGEGTGFLPVGARVRTVDLPAGLSERDLIKLSSGEIDQIIQQAGPVVGYAAMIRLAAGAGGTPPATQFHAAKFLIERAAALEEQKRSMTGAARGLQNLTNEQLQALVESLEKENGGPLPAPPGDLAQTDESESPGRPAAQ